MDFTWYYVLYRLYNSSQNLLYIGRTNDINKRFSKHAQIQPWWPEVTMAKIELLSSLDTLMRAEQLAIFAERPKYNIVHNGMVVAEEDEPGWREPWINVSTRVTAGADRLHEECRWRRANDYPKDDYMEGGYRVTAPCGPCFQQALVVIGAADAVAGYTDETVIKARDIFDKNYKPIKII